MKKIKMVDFEGSTHAMIIGGRVVFTGATRSFLLDQARFLFRGDLRPWPHASDTWMTPSGDFAQVLRVRYPMHRVEIIQTSFESGRWMVR